MLIQFTVKNFRSFKEEATIHLEAAGSKSAGKADLVHLGGQRLLLPSVGVFGANASGKTNLLKALSFVAGAINNEQPLQNPPSSNELLQTHRLDKESMNQPSFFQIVLGEQADSSYREYTYGFEIGSRYIVSEQLTIKDKVRSNFSTRTVFERRFKDGGSEFKFHPKDRSELESLRGRVIEEGLAVITFAEAGNSPARGLLDLINTSLRSGRPARFYGTEILDDVGLSNLAMSLYRRQPSILEDALPMISGSDFGIQNITVGPKGIFTTHSQYGQEATHEVFDLLSDESWGTRKLFMVGLIMRDALNNGGCLVLDDLGSGMHPLLTAEIVKRFNDSATNPRGAQLIYSSHEDYLLSPEVGLRKDQIYFTKKDKQEASILHGLAEYDAREELDFRRNYLFGRFGALPNLELDGAGGAGLGDNGGQ